MLQLGEHVVVVVLHAADLKGAAVEGVVQLQHPSRAAGLAKVCLQRAVIVDAAAIICDLLLGQPAAQPVEHLFFQRIARELFHLHQLQIDGCHMGAALGLDVHHAGYVQHEQRFPHGGAADAQFFRQLPVVQRVAGLELHGNDPAANGLVGRFARTE